MKAFRTDNKCQLKKNELLCVRSLDYSPAPTTVDLGCAGKFRIITWLAETIETATERKIIHFIFRGNNFYFVRN